MNDHDLEEKLSYAFYAVFGAGVGFVVFLMALGGWSLVFTGQASKPWNGLGALLICLVIGGGWGLVAYRYRHQEFGSAAPATQEGPTAAMLCSKRLMAVGTCLAGLYFLWQLAKGMR